MKKICKLALILLLISVILSTHLPIIVLAEDLQTQINNQETLEKNGEVIIMYKQNVEENNIKKKSIKSNIPAFLADYAVEDTVKFEDLNNGAINSTSADTDSDSSLVEDSDMESISVVATNSATNSTTNSATNSDSSTDLVISLIKSDKYSTSELMEELSKEQSVMCVQKNHEFKLAGITNDTYEKYQWAIENVGQNGGKVGADINPEMITTELSEEKVIAVLDSGIDYNHPDLKNSMWNNPYEENRLLQGKHGYNFVKNNDDPMDDNGHGTHVAGIIAAEANNNQGITGALLDQSNFKLMSLKIADEDGVTNDFRAISAYHYIYRAQQLGSNVIAVNNSWCGPYTEEDEVLEIVIDLVGEGPKGNGRGALSICAAGNDSQNTDSKSTNPACLNSDYIISVAATNEKDELASFSNYGVNSVDIAAPGTDILSTVSYNCFNPSIYEDKTSLCSQYESFDSGLGNFKYSASAGTVTASGEEYFGKSGQSLKWQFDAEKGMSYSLKIPYTGKSDKQQISMMLKATSNIANAGKCRVYYDSKEYLEQDIDANTSNITQKKEININLAKGYNYWEHVYNSFGNGGTVSIVFIANENAKVEIYMDDYAVSNINKSEEDFQKYNFYQGTSMATPFVTAAVGVASNYRDENAIRRKERILGATRKTDNLSNKVKTGGVIDIERLSKPNIVINSAKINTNGELIINVQNMRGMPAVYINDEEAKATVIDSENLEIVNKDLINTTAKITLEMDDTNYATRSFYLKAGKSYKYEDTICCTNYIDNLFTDGKNIYVYTSECGELNKIELSEQHGLVEKSVAILEDSIMDLLEEPYEFAQYTYSIRNSDFVVINNKIYTIFTFDYGFAKDVVLAYYDNNIDDQMWRKVKTIPTLCNNLSEYTLGAYNGNLYIIGGYNNSTNKVSKKVYEFNLATKKCTAVADLPEGRFGSKATQVGDKLLVSFGGTDDGSIPSILIYDGNKWTKSSAKISLKSNSGKYQDIKYYKLGTGLVSGGLIFSGINAEKYGNTFYYDIATDTYKKSGYVINGSAKTEGIAVGNKYYIINKQDDYYQLDVRYMPVKTGLSKLSVIYPKTGIKATMNAILANRKKYDENRIENTYYYMPGSKMNFNLYDTSGYYIKSFKVDGKQVTGYKYSNTIGADRNIVITTAKNTGLIKLNKTSANLTSFSTLKLTATLSDTSATAVTWKSSNNNYATISSKGVITPKWAGNGKTVTITASTTYNGRKAFVESKINIKAPTINNLKAKTTKNSITLNWSTVSGADGYEIYAYNNSTKKYALYKKTKTNIVTDSNLKAGTTYKFQVLAYKTIDKKKCVTARSTITCATLKK